MLLQQFVLLMLPQHIMLLMLPQHICVVDVATVRCEKFVAQAGSKNQVLPKKNHHTPI
jgi:hypothetical protein